jgi:hypothetical protein
VCLAASICESRALPGTLNVNNDNADVPESVASGSSAATVLAGNRGHSATPVLHDATNTPSQPDNETLGCSDDSGSETDSRRAKKQKGKKKDKGKGVYRRPVYEKSEYEKERDANIARNKAILAKLNEEWEERLKVSSKGVKRPAGKVGQPSRVPHDRVSPQAARLVDLCNGVSDINIPFVSPAERTVPDNSSTTSTDVPPTTTTCRDGVDSPGSAFDTLFAQSEEPGNPHMTVENQPVVSASGTDKMDDTVTPVTPTPSKTVAPAQLGPGVSCLNRKPSDASTWPSWLSNAMEYLKGVSTSPEWVALVTKLVVFEEAIGFSNTVSLMGYSRTFKTLIPST